MALPTPDKMNFLVVDDMDNMRRSVRAMLKLIQFGREFFEASNGREAWKVLEESESTIHFIISDWNMPHMSGTELLNMVRGSRKYRDTPFLMVTAEANKEVVAEAAENDVDAYLTKPFVTASLEQKIKELIDNANNPAPYTRHLLAARDLEEKGKLDEALAHVIQAAKINERSSRPLREMGRLYLKKDDIKKAQACFEQAIKLNRLDVPSFHFLGQIYYRMNMIDRAIEYFSKAMDISPRHSDRALKFANLLLKKKKLREAEKILAIVLRNNPANLDFKEDVAETCFDNGLYVLAVRSYRDILHNDPDRSYLNKKLGMALHRKGSSKDAINILEKAAEQFGEDLDLLLALANSYLDIKMAVRAEKWATQVMRIDPGNQDAKEILDKCL